MCGISGIFSRKSNMDAKFIQSMTDAIKHRGPDDEGYLAVNLERGNVCPVVGNDSKIEGQHINTFNQPANLYLGHRRLSIIEPSPAGHQPMSNNNQTLWIVYNGEIYNYIELREELEKLGYLFQTNSDTEVLLAAYEVWGSECVNRFNGMWAFVIFDKKKNVLFGSRDRFGVKPFYYYNKNACFAFASEMKALIKLPFIEKEVNPKAVFDYLAMGLIENEEEGFFKGIYELFPSQSFELNLTNGDFKKWTYFSLDYNDNWEKFDQIKSDKHVNNVRAHLFDAVDLRLRSDVPVGTCLSGGIDSSSIVCIINDIMQKNHLDQLGQSQKVFTSCYENSTIDESDWAGHVVDNTNTAWFKTFPTSDGLLEDLQDLIYSQEIPFGSTSIYAQYRVMKLASENGVKVLLDGQGGDELFAGYVPYYGAFLTDIVRSGDISRLMLEMKNMSNSPTTSGGMIKFCLMQHLAAYLPASIRRTLQKLYIKENKYISRDFWEACEDRIDLVRETAPLKLNEMLHKQIAKSNLKGLLKYEDRNSMRFSIEARTPFADDINMIKYLFGVSSSYKIQKGWSKFLLRESMEGILPDKIKRRVDKIGFATPEYNWINSAPDEFRELINKNVESFLDVKKIHNDWDNLIKKQEKTGITSIWRIINLSAWMNNPRLFGS